MWRAIMLSVCIRIFFCAERKEASLVWLGRQCPSIALGEKTSSRRTNQQPNATSRRSWIQQRPMVLTSAVRPAPDKKTCYQIIACRSTGIQHSTRHPKAYMYMHDYDVPRGYPLKTISENSESEEIPFSFKTSQQNLDITRTLVDFGCGGTPT